MNKNLLIVFVIFCLVLVAACTSPPVNSGSSGQVHGIVKLPCPMSGEECDFFGSALIKILDTNHEIVSDYDNGEFLFEVAKAGSYTITANKKGYQTNKQTIQVLENQTTEVGFELEESIPVLGKGGLTSLVFDVESFPFDDAKVRKALNYAIDKSALVNDYNNEFGEDVSKALGPIPSEMLGYNQGVEAYSYDSEQAETLLSQAGYEQGLELDIYFFEYKKDRFLFEKIKDQLSKIGVTLTLHGIDGWTNYLNQMQNKDFSFFRLHWSADTVDTMDFLYDLYHTQGKANFGNYSNSILDNKINQSYYFSEDNDYTQFIEDAEELIIEDSPSIFLFYD